MLINAVGYQNQEPENNNKTASGISFTAVDGSGFDIQSIKAMDGDEIAGEDTFTFIYVKGNAFRYVSWWGPETLVAEPDGEPLGIWGWGDGDTGVIEDKLFKAGEMFLVQPGTAGKSTLQVSGGVKTWSSDEAIARVQIENYNTTSCGNPFPVAYDIQEVKAFDGEEIAGEDTFTFIYVKGNAFRYVSWWGPETLVAEPDGEPLGIWGWGDGDTGVIEDKEFKAGEGFLVQPGTAGTPYLGFPNPFYVEK